MDWRGRGAVGWVRAVARDSIGQAAARKHAPVTLQVHVSFVGGEMGALLTAWNMTGILGRVFYQYVRRTVHAYACLTIGRLLSATRALVSA